MEWQEDISSPNNAEESEEMMDDEDASDFDADSIDNEEIRYLSQGNGNEEMESTNHIDEDDGNEDEFDRNLPATHSYLPQGLRLLHGRSMLDPGWEGEIPCIPYHHISFPGEFFPMMSTHADMFTNIINGNRLYGLICPDNRGFYSHSKYGTLCEVLEATSSEVLHRSDVKIIVKSTTRYRFRISEGNKGRNSLREIRDNPMIMLRIKILPEVVTHDPLNNAGFFSIGRYKHCKDTCLNRKLQRSESMNSTFPSFFMKSFDIRDMIEQVKTYFRFDRHIKDLPEDLVALSFWVSTHIAISDKERMELFKIDNALLRLFVATNHMKKIRYLSCNTCMTVICDRNNYLQMSKEGLTGKYCNVGGHVHDILTVKTAKNLHFQGTKSKEFTWFPGYYWTIAICASCFHHMGWRFDAENKSLRPSFFYGLVRNMVVPTKGEEDKD